MWQNFKSGKSVAGRSIPRKKYFPENLSALGDLHFDLSHTNNIFRTRSQTALDPVDLESADLHQSFSREASSSTPPDSQLLHHFSLFHNKSTPNHFVGPSVSSTPTHTITVQNTPVQPTFLLVNPPLVNPPSFPASVTTASDSLTK